MGTLKVNSLLTSSILTLRFARESIVKKGGSAGKHFLPTRQEDTAVSSEDDVLGQFLDG